MHVHLFFFVFIHSFLRVSLFFLLFMCLKSLFHDVKQTNHDVKYIFHDVEQTFLNVK
jgi:hypothetical protein